MNYPSEAHEQSSPYLIDPAYAAETPFPPPVDSHLWLYPRAEYECFLLSRMRRETAALKLNVGYPGAYHEPFDTTYFRKYVQPGSLVFGVNGTVDALFNSSSIEIIRGEGSDAAILTPFEGMLVLKVSVDDPALSVPAIKSSDDDWEASVDGISFSPAHRNAAPSGETLPVLDIPLTQLPSGSFDAGREVLAFLDVNSVDRPAIAVGESLYELANRDDTQSEQSRDLVQVSASHWRTPLPLAFRYASVTAASPCSVSCQAVFSPACYRGAFHADPELDRIWMSSAYTLRLCMHHFILDGIKRDRLPWLGDLAISLMANAYTFAEGDFVKRTLAAIGRAGIKEQHLNGIIDYSLWYFVCHDRYQLYFDDHGFLSEQYREIKEILLDILKIAEDNDGFLPDKSSWCFIDWVECEKATALQMLFYLALRSAARTAERMHDMAVSTRCHTQAESLKQKLFATAFDPSVGLFFATPGKPESGFIRHPNFLAIIADLVDSAQSAHIVQELLSRNMPPTGTPYMASLEIIALYRGGRADAAIDSIRKIWGGMLKRGATTFFEAYDETATDEQLYAFYGRPYAMSLCHAWSSGPAALLPLIVFGCEPTSDGWKTFHVNKTSPLSSACATVPAAESTICLESVEGNITSAKFD